MKYERNVPERYKTIETMKQNISAYIELKHKINEHQWTIDDNKFVCADCGYTANEEESKYLATCHWSNCYFVDIHSGKPKES